MSIKSILLVFKDLNRQVVFFTLLFVPGYNISVWHWRNLSRHALHEIASIRQSPVV
jgi:hypothetical protein